MGLECVGKVVEVVQSRELDVVVSSVVAWVSYPVDRQQPHSLGATMLELRPDIVWELGRMADNR